MIQYVLRSQSQQDLFLMSSQNYAGDEDDEDEEMADEDDEDDAELDEYVYMFMVCSA